MNRVGHREVGVEWYEKILLIYKILKRKNKLANKLKEKNGL